MVISQGNAASKIGLPPYYETETAVNKTESLKGFQHINLSIDQRPIHLVHTGNKLAPVVLFIHGSPGSWAAWANYLVDKDLQAKTFMIAVDRPGFGGSSDGIAGESIEAQSDRIIQAVKKISPNKRFIIVGHSYGGPVALRLAIDYPDDIESMVLLAPAIEPKSFHPRWYNRIAQLGVVYWALPAPLKYSNKEMIPLKKELIKMEPYLKNIKVPVQIIQGQKDKLVDPDNANFAKKSLINAPVNINILSHRGHFIPWEEYKLVKETIIKQLRVLSD